MKEKWLKEVNVTDQLLAVHIKLLKVKNSINDIDQI